MVKVDVMGFVGKAPEKTTTGAKSYWKFSVATQDRKGADQDPTWYTINFDDSPRAEKLCSYIQKGSHVLVTGRLNIRPHKDAGKMPWLDVYASPELFSFTSSKSTSQQQKAANEKVDESHADIPF